jgi:hypothetical protein
MVEDKNSELHQLNPYDGSHPILPDGCPKVLVNFGGDASGRVAYSFNSLGFRGEEFRPAADRHIFVSGDCLTFGLGLEYSDCWTSVFQREYARIHGLHESNVNLCNFSSNGCSNSYIARTLIGQCSRVRPSLAIAALTSAPRAEMLYDRRSYNIGPWWLTPGYAERALTAGYDQQLFQMIRLKAKAYFDLHTDLWAEQETVKNALLLQLFFQSRQIPFLIGIFSTKPKGELPDREILKPWTTLLDCKTVFGVPILDCVVDRTVLNHPGAASALLIAEKFASRYREVFGKRAAPDSVRRVDR